MFKILDRRDCFYQWDSNRQIVIEDINCNEVHYSNRTDKTALVCTVREENGQRIADVPNILLQEDWDITVYAFDQNYTKYSQTIKVMPRAKPDDYVYTETEVLNYNTLSQRIDDLENNIGQEIQDYLEENPVQAPVQSVNEKTGAVVLTAADVGAATEDYVDNAVENIELTPGPKGDKGNDGVTPHIGENNNWFIGDVDTGVQAEGQDGAPGVGVPAGGTTGQVLAKKSGTDYDTEWIDQTGGGGSGTPGEDGGYYQPNVDTSGNLTWTASKSDMPAVAGSNIMGPRGNPGFSPIATVTQTGTGATISIQDATGTTTATITNGQDGADGYTPIKGTDYWTESDKAEIVQEAASSIPIATTEVAGKVKPDGTTITVTEDGTISAVGGGSGGASTAADISFDNSGTGLAATNVQAALVEINEDLVGHEEVQSMIDADITDLYRARGEGLVALMMEDRKYFQNTVMLSNVPTPEEVYETLKKYGAVNRGVGTGTVSLSASELRSCVTSLDGISAIKILRIDNDGEVSVVTSININGLFRFSIYIVVPYVLLISDDSYAKMSPENLAKFREYIGLPKLSTVDSRITALEDTVNSLVDGNEVSY